MNERVNLSDVFIAAGRLESALALAIQAGDDCVGTVAAARLALTLRRVARALDMDMATNGASVESMFTLETFARSTRSMYELLSQAPINLDGCDPQRLNRWAIARQRSQESLGGPHVFELDAAGADLSCAQFLGVHVAQCRFITSLQRARFVGAVIEGTDFMYSNLRDSQWQGTEVHRSVLRHSCLVGASLERTTFRRCDLRDVDLTVTRHDVLLSDVRFISCDLRGVNWAGRDLSRVVFVDCRTEAMTGVAAQTTDDGQGQGAEGRAGGRRLAAVESP
jgi:uncharacterized protein YjbI with pentapeptide repeats